MVWFSEERLFFSTLTSVRDSLMSGGILNDSSTGFRGVTSANLEKKRRQVLYVFWSSVVKRIFQ